MKRKILGILGVILLVCCVGVGWGVKPASARPVASDENDMGGGAAQSTAAADCGGSFLFLKPWYSGLCTGSGANVEIKEICEKDSCGANTVKLATFVWTIVLNVIFDISLAIGYLAVAMVIVGGYQYIAAQGDPGKAAKGMKTLSTAITGTILAMGASVVVNTIISVLDIQRDGGWKQTFDNGSLSNIFNWAYGMAGLVAVIFIIRGGVMYLTSSGNPAKASQATRSIIHAVVGLVIVIMAALITNFVMMAIAGAL